MQTGGTTDNAVVVSGFIISDSPDKNKPTNNVKDYKSSAASRQLGATLKSNPLYASRAPFERGQEVVDNPSSLNHNALLDEGNSQNTNHNHDWQSSTSKATIKVSNGG